MPLNVTLFTTGLRKWQPLCDSVGLHVSVVKILIKLEPLTETRTPAE